MLYKPGKKIVYSSRRRQQNPRRFKNNLNEVINSEMAPDELYHKMGAYEARHEKADMSVWEPALHKCFIRRVKGKCFVPEHRRTGLIDEVDRMRVFTQEFARKFIEERVKGKEWPEQSRILGNIANEASLITRQAKWTTEEFRKIGNLFRPNKSQTAFLFRHEIRNIASSIVIEMALMTAITDRIRQELVHAEVRKHM